MSATTHDIAFDERTALVVVDVQNDFADPRGSLYVDGGDRIVPVVNELVAAARAAGALVVYTQDWHPEATPHFQKDGGIWPVHCLAGSWGAQLHPDLDVDGPVVRKGTGGEDGYSGFTARDVTTGEDKPTDLRSVLNERGITRVVVVGLAQDVCVKETALDARRLGYDTAVPLAATRAVNLTVGDDRRAVEVMVDAGADVR
ncbi:MAG: isochorismatase family protein [Actinomycetota bacterium]|nr:isochorismatase family protein [Actinomycetota bacterium]